jgi:cation transport regulator ChaC
VSDESLWIFGYGSLVWRPSFSHRRRLPAALPGWSRRFWQGSTDHRGVPSRPGRVVTLLPSDHASIRAENGGWAGQASGGEERCWGTAYEVHPEDREAVLERLDHRERGGYERHEVEISVRVGGSRLETRAGLVYIAGPRNENYLGPAALADIARQIAGASGPSGANPEYVFELARSLRRMGVDDDHVFSVEAAVTRLLRRPGP